MNGAPNVRTASRVGWRGTNDGTRPQWRHWSSASRGERPSTDGRDLEIWGYAGKPSYSSGEVLTLHVSTTADRFSVLIIRDGAHEETVCRIDECSGACHDTPSDAYAGGCGWPAGVELEIPSTWRPGGYVVEFTAADERGSVTQEAFFVVRATAPGDTGGLAVVLATHTWQEYNDWGGGSGYSLDPVATADESAGGHEPRDASAFDDVARIPASMGFSPRVSYDRPWGRGFVRLPVGAPRVSISHPPPLGWATRYEQPEWALANGYSHMCGYAGWASYDSLFVRWAERQGYEVELLTQWDLDQTPGLLDGYRCVVSVGHDEYWTAAGREQLDAFVERGGNYVRLAGNIAWQVRMEDQGKTEVCYKTIPDADPLCHSPNPQDRTGLFDSLGIGNPPVTTFGANATRGAYARIGGASPRGVGGFIVYRNDHWAFEGTDLYYGDVLGGAVPLVAYEVDGVAYTFRNGLPVPTGEDGTPPGLEILALTPATLNEEDHGITGAALDTGDADLASIARLVFGKDTHEQRERIRRGASVITSMKKGRGEVFCGGTTEWPYALAQSEPMVERVVSNVLQRFLRPSG
jgi:hypothetical protein